MRLTDNDLRLAFRGLSRAVRSADTSAERGNLTRLAGKVLDELERREQRVVPLHMKLRQHAGPGSRVSQ